MQKIGIASGSRAPHLFSGGNAVRFTLPLFSHFVCVTNAKNSSSLLSSSSTNNLFYVMLLVVAYYRVQTRALQWFSPLFSISFSVIFFCSTDFTCICLFQIHFFPSASLLFFFFHYCCVFVYGNRARHTQKRNTLTERGRGGEEREKKPS